MNFLAHRLKTQGRQQEAAPCVDDGNTGVSGNDHDLMIVMVMVRTVVVLLGIVGLMVLMVTVVIAMITES